MVATPKVVGMTDRVDLPWAGLLCGCRKVRELVPKVCLARFHKETFPSLLGRPGAGETEPGLGLLAEDSGSDIIILTEPNTRIQNSYPTQSSDI